MRNFWAAALAALWVGAAPGAAQQLAAVAPAAADRPAVERGPETGLPLPRYVSLKGTEGRARRGPARSHRVDWIFTRRDMPLRVTAEFEHWRRVEDVEGQGGWIHYGSLSGVRTVLLTRDMVAMRSQPRANAPEVALLERGVVARILTCQPDWCRLGAEGQRGWVERRALWGVDPHEWLD
jgi:SH3-like domain-containing protein